MTAPPTAPTAPSHTDRAVRLPAAIRVTLVIALTALVLAIAALAYVVSFEAIRAFAIETAAFPPSLAWSAPLLVDSFTTAASLVILWRYLCGDAWRDPWYAWTLVGAATAVSVALNVAHAPERLAAQLFAALPPVALLGALELLMSVARTGLPHQPHSASDPASPRRPWRRARPHSRRQRPAPPGRGRPRRAPGAHHGGGLGHRRRTGCAVPGAGAGRPRTRRRPHRDRGRGDRGHRPQPPPRLRAAARRPSGRVSASWTCASSTAPAQPAATASASPMTWAASAASARMPASRPPTAPASATASRPTSAPSRRRPAAAPAKSTPAGSATGPAGPHRPMPAAAAPAPSAAPAAATAGRILPSRPGRPRPRPAPL
jgi:Protein of unknown function (DUF2637)